MDSGDFQKRFEEAYKLLNQETTNREKFESVRILIKGFNPKVDAALEKVSGALSDVEKLEKGDYIELSVEKLPEATEEEKKRKKAIIAFIRHWKDLTSEVERVRGELSKNNEQSANQQAQSFGRIIKLAKGPFGIVTIAAVAIVAVISILNLQKSPAQQETVKQTPTKQKIQAIVVGDKKIPLSEVHVATGPECDGDPHYHANASAAKATDGTNVPDPGGCGYGKVEDVKIEEVDLP